MPEEPHLEVVVQEFGGLGDGDLLYVEGSRDEWVVSCAPDAEDDCTSVDYAVQYLLEGVPVYVEPDVVPGTPSWFCGRDEGESGQEWYVGLCGFTHNERAEIGRRVYGG